MPRHRIHSIDSKHKVETLDKDHGRIKTRRAASSAEIATLEEEGQGVCGGVDREAGAKVGQRRRSEEVEP
jgi:hypothetical protein